MYRVNHYRSPGGASRLNDVAPQSQMPNLFLPSRFASRPSTCSGRLELVERRALRSGDPH